MNVPVPVVGRHPPEGSWTRYTKSTQGSNDAPLVQHSQIQQTTWEEVQTGLDRNGGGSTSRYQGSSVRALGHPTVLVQWTTTTIPIQLKDVFQVAEGMAAVQSIVRR